MVNKGSLKLLIKLKETQLLDKLPTFKNIKRILTWDPLKIQEMLLIEILKKNKNTAYGKKYKFKEIKNIQEYQEKLPIIKFPDIKDYVEQIKKGKQNILSKEKVIYFATTSGTTSEPKYIPVTKLRMKMFVKQLLIWGYHVAGKKIKPLNGKTLYFAGTDLCGHTKGGIPHGNISGYIIKNLPWYAKKKLVVPWQTYRINNFEERTRTIALLALKSNISQILFAEPIEAIIFFDYLKENKKNLLEELNRKGNKRLVKRLEKKKFVPTELWPKLSTVNCIKTHMNGIYLETLRKKLGPRKVTIRDPGIYSSEAGISLCISDEGAHGIPLYTMIFFEFLEQPEKKGQKPLMINELKEGKEYKIILTNPEGLYRYNLEDVVRVVGFKRKIPLIQFVNRSKFIDIAGEKCPEAEVVNAVNKGLTDSKIKVKAFTVIPHIERLDKKPRYEILMEGTQEITNEQAKKFLKKFDEELQKLVIDYENMRNEYGRIDKPILTLLKKGSYEAFEKKRVLTTGQPKIINVSKDPEFKKNFVVEKTIFI